MENNPWDGIEGLANKAKEAVVDTVKKFVPWEGIDTTPKEKPPKQKQTTMDMSVEAVPVKTEAQMRLAVQDVGPDTSDPRQNIAEIDVELKNAKDPSVIKILQDERRKNEKRLRERAPR